MLRFPSIGPIELFILAGGAGLLLAVGVVVVALILKSKSIGRRIGVGVLVAIVLAVFLLPLLVVGLGILLVTPVRQVREPAVGSQEMVVISEQVIPTGTVELPAPGPLPTVTPPPVRAPGGSAHRDFLDPDNTLTWAIVLPSIAGLALLIGTAGLVLLATSWSKMDPRAEVGTTRRGTRAKWARTRNVLLVLFSWFALSAFLVLDLLFAISLSYRFVALYAAFWALVGALLLHDRPLREKLVVLSLLVLVLFSVRFVDWTSRKPFLKHFYRIEAGMTPAEVDRIMGGYMRENGGGPVDSEDQYVYDERGTIVDGWVTFRHTDKGWGDADEGVVAFDDGHVTETQFFAD